MPEVPRCAMYSGCVLDQLSWQMQRSGLLTATALAFVIGGFIVGLKSTGRTILEPGISAAIAVLIALLLSGTFTVGNLLVGGLILFAAGILGGWLGERRQEQSAAQNIARH